MKNFRVSLILLVALASLLSTAAFAEIPLTFGARIGYSIPTGSLVKDYSLSKEMSGALPIQLEVLYRITPQIHAGAYFSYGPGFAGSDFSQLTAGQSASLSQIRYGVEGQYHFATDPDAMDPWGGITLGMESAHASTSADSAGNSSSVAASGFMFGLEGGVSWMVREALRVGPYLGLAIGSYGSESVTQTQGGASSSSSQDITETAIHTWITLGVAGTFSL